MKRFLRELLNAGLIVTAVFCAAMGIKGFLLPSHFIDGGITGLSMLLASATAVPLSILIPVINAAFILIAYRYLGWPFALRSALAIAALAVVLAVVPFPDVTPDHVLTAVFGGFLVGAGIGLAIRGGAVLDGTEIAALLISRRVAMFRVGDLILAFNVVLFASAIFLLGVQEALYSILTYIAATRTLDFILHGIDEYTAMMIVSDRSAEIRQAVVHQLGRGVTVIAGKGGMTGVEREILYCVVTRLEIARVRGIAKELDPGAFIVVQALVDVYGGTVRRTLHH